MLLKPVKQRQLFLCELKLGLQIGQGLVLPRFFAKIFCQDFPVRLGLRGKTVKGNKFSKWNRSKFKIFFILVTAFIEM